VFLDDLYQQMEAYLSKEGSLDDFRSWFVLASWDASRQGDPLLASLVREIDIRLIEVSNSDLSEDVFRRRLQSLASTRFVRIGQVANVTSGSGDVIFSQPIVSVRRVDRQPAMAS
jgi:hypothetical protein